MKRHKTILCICLIASVFLGMTGGRDYAKAATELSGYITEGELGRASYRSMRVGEERDGWGIGFNQSRTVKSATWSSSDTTVMTVNGNNSGATLKAHREGTAVLSLTIVTNKNETITDECLISSITTLASSSQPTGYVKDTATFYRGASTAAKVRNTAPAKQQMTVIALCSDFYRVRLPESYDFNDILNQDTAYVLKSKIEIPTTSVAISNADEARELKVGDKVTASPAVLPELATLKDLVWDSSNETVASVDASGRITARKAGKATITLTERHSGKKASVSVTVSDILATSVEVTNADDIKNMAVGGTTAAKAVISPSNTTKQELTWKSDNTKVLTVDSDGTIKALAGGTGTITVTEKYSGVSASVTIHIGYSLGASKANSRPTIKLKKCSDFRGNYLSWNKIRNAKYYRIYIEHWDTAKKKYVKTYKNGKKIKTTYYNDEKVVSKGKYRYCVVAYDSKNKPLTAKEKKAKKVKVKATAPDLSVSIGQLSALKLRWDKNSPKKRKGIQGYKIYRSTAANGKYVMVKQIKNKNATSWTDTGLEQGKTFYYRIRAYGKVGKKKTNGAYSAMKSACTISEVKNWNYFNTMKDIWKGVCMEKGSITAQQSTDKMKNYSVKKDGNTVYPYIKYHLTSDTLFIHVYVRYYTYDRVMGKETKVSEEKGVYLDGTDGNGGSYKAEFINGVTSTFSTLIQGNDNDFADGVVFHTKLILHDKDERSYADAQEFLGVSICGDCDCMECSSCPLDKLNTSNNYWSHAYPCIDGSVFSDQNRLHIADNEHLILNGKKQPLEKQDDFSTICAHEMGHILGLDDGYAKADSYGISSIRMTYNTETCLWKNDDWRNLMIQSRNYSMVRPNDMEMILLAYGLSFDWRQNQNSLLQHYRSYYWDAIPRYISEAIKEKEDKKNGK